MTTETAPERPTAIGPWEPHERDGELVFVHSADPALFGFFAPIQELRPKRTLLPLRICLLGESAAAGWLYAPHVTPAKILEARLSEIRGRGIFEVIDLTRIDLSARNLVDLARTAGQLTPDLMVVFAGNNWPIRWPHFPDVATEMSQRCAAAWRASGHRGLGEISLEQTKRNAERTLKELAAISDDQGTAFVIVVPEVNLGTWERRRPVSWLPGDGAREWHRLHSLAEERLDAADFSSARSLALDMIRLDAGACATSHAILALAEEGAGALDRASACRQQALSAFSLDAYPSLPGATPAIQEELVTSEERYGFSAVDLRRIFREQLGSPIPWSRLFLDYCHLTLEGMTLAMAAVAERVLAITDPSHVPSSSPAVVPVAAEVDARAKLMSGIYAAHWSWRSGDLSLSTRWWEAALDAWDGCAVEMERFLRSRAAPGEAMPLSLAAHGREDSAQLAGLQLRHLPTLDAELFPAMIALLERRVPGFDPSALIDELIATHGVEAGEVDLLNAIYRYRPLEHEEGGPLGDPRRLPHASRWPKSRFCLVAAGEVEVALDLVARLPAIRRPRSERVSIELNGEVVASVEIGDRWSKASIVLPADRVARGINQLALGWPPLEADGDAAMRTIAERWEQHQPADIHPVFGEIARLVALQSSF